MVLVYGAMVRRTIILPCACLSVALDRIALLIKNGSSPTNSDEELKKKVSQSLNVSEDKVLCKGCRNENGTIAYLDIDLMFKIA